MKIDREICCCRFLIRFSPILFLPLPQISLHSGKTAITSVWWSNLKKHSLGQSDSRSYIEKVNHNYEWMKLKFLGDFIFFLSFFYSNFFFLLHLFIFKSENKMQVCIFLEKIYIHCSSTTVCKLEMENIAINRACWIGDMSEIF